MNKYIISTGLSVVSEINPDKYVITTEPEKAVSFDTIGDAMLEASKLNKILNSPTFKVMTVEV